MTATHAPPLRSLAQGPVCEPRIAVHPIESLDPHTYDTLAADSFFASRGFLELWRVQGGRPVVWTATRDGRVVAALPGIEYGRGPLARFVAMPDGCYARLLVHPDARAEARMLGAALLDAIGRAGYGRVHLFDFDGQFDATARFARLASTTHVVEVGNLAGRPRDQKIRKQVRKALREGTHCEDYDAGRHRSGFLRIADHTYRRHGVRTRYSPDFFDALARLAARDPRIIWRHCVTDGRAACSHVYFVEGDMMVAWQAYFDRRFGFLMPNVFMRLEAAETAAERGLSLLNFGATPFEAKGLLHFKDRWRTRSVPFATLVHFGAIAAAVESLLPGDRPRPEPRTAGDV